MDSTNKECCKITKAGKMFVDIIEYEKINGQENVTNTIQEDKTLEVQTFEHDNVCNVTVALGATLPMGNFSFARIDVSITVPSYLEQVEDAYKFASKFVHDKIAEQRSKLPTKK